MYAARKKRDSLLAKLKIVHPGYPFYGQVVLRSGRQFDQVLTPGSIIVAPYLLDRLGLQVGDSLHVGSTTLKIADVVLQEPDQPVNLFLLGPRIFIAAPDIDRLDLVKKRKPGSTRLFNQSHKRRRDRTDSGAAQISRRWRPGKCRYLSHGQIQNQTLFR